MQGRRACPVQAAEMFQRCLGLLGTLRPLMAAPGAAVLTTDTEEKVPFTRCSCVSLPSCVLVSRRLVLGRSRVSQGFRNTTKNVLCA